MMGGLSLRLSDELDERLDAEARREGVPRSEIARIAITEFLSRKERDRFVAAFVAEARCAYGDPAIRTEAVEIGEEALPLDNEALDLAERTHRQQARHRSAAQRKGRK